MAERMPLIRWDGMGALCAVAAASLWILVGGCSDPDTDLNERLRSDITLIHDQVMRQTGLIFDLRVRLGQLRKALENDLQDQGRKIDELSEALEEADRMMFAWMNQYQTLAVDDDIGVDNAYRQEQLEAIRSVSRRTDTAVSAAEQFIAAAEADAL
ncbi:MAG: hypothetical protein LJE64_00780 [Desulfofustis sp.]|jgi:hypothetical protein|nr:hypothetical protein [Desulfofustis sp.]